jgi:hypothetical protein
MTARKLSIKPDEFDYAPFSPGVLGKAHPFFGEALPTSLDELNEMHEY